MTGPEIVERIEYRVNDEYGGDCTIVELIPLVLDAIREPSDALIRTGHEAYCADDSEDVEEGILAAWRAMIAALRKEIAG